LSTRLDRGAAWSRPPVVGDGDGDAVVCN